MSKVKQVLIFRKDLKVRKGKIASQVAHGAVANITNNLVGYPFKWYKFPFFYLKFLWLFITHAPLRDWLSGRFTKIVLGVPSEYELLQIYTKAKAQGLICSLITDAGLTEFGGVPTKTVVAIGPDESYKIDKLTGHLKPL
jgi:PTH2 family peptidyl-tRNA hydrolase